MCGAVGMSLLDSAGRMAEEMQGLRQQNALLRAHLERLVHVHEQRLRNENQVAVAKRPVSIVLSLAVHTCAFLVR